MEKKTTFLEKKAGCWYVSVIALACAAISLVVYVLRGGNYLSPVNSMAVTLMIVGVVVNALILLKDFRIGAFIPFVMYMCVFGILLNSEMLFISNVAFGVDGNFLDTGFFVFVGTNILSIFFSAIAATGKMTK
jgi:hypothetical protein